MTILALEDEFASTLFQLVESLPPMRIEDEDLAPLESRLDALPSYHAEPLARLGAACRSLLADNGYVCLRGLPVGPDVRTILTLGMELGVVFSDLSHQPTIVSEASPCLGARLQGNQTEALFLHTDFAMLNQPPAATMIQCRESDPLGNDYGRNGVAVAQHIVSRYFGSEELELVLNTPMPFAGVPRLVKTFFSVPLSSRCVPVLWHQ